jgi:hypothetical protein
LSRPLSTEKLCSADLSSRYTRMSRRRNACPFNPLIRGDRGHFRLACQERPAG